MKIVALLRLFVLRNMKAEKFLTLLSIIGVALGTGLFIGVKIASDRAIGSFENAIRGLNTYTTYEISDPSGIDFEEGIFPSVLSIEENSFPVLTATGSLTRSKETVTLHGIHTVKSLRFLKLGPENAADLELFYKVPNGVAVTDEFARKHGVRRDDTLTVSLYDKEYTLSVVAVLNVGTLSPDAMIMDLGNFQEFFGKTGYLSRIELATDEEKARGIESALPPHLALERKDDIIREQKGLISSFRYNLQFVSLLAILVGIFLLYNTVFISVIKRRTEIGILRALGTGKGTVMMLFTAQGLILGLVGSLLGIVMGQLTAYFSVAAVEKTISTMYTTVSIPDFLLTTSDAVKALLLGLCISFAASAIPSYEASKVRPHESSREGSFEGRYRRYAVHFLWLGLFLVVAGALISYLEYVHVPFSFPYLSYTGILLIILGFTCVAPFYLTRLLRLSKGPLVRLFGATGRMAQGDMRGSIYRLSIALMSVAISSALIVALITLIFSFRGSLIGWIDRTISADVYIKPASCVSNYCFDALPEEVISIVEGFPEVAGVDRYRALRIEILGRKVTAGFGSTEVTRRLGGTRYFRQFDEERMRELETGNQIGMSSYLAMKHGLKRGDTIEIRTPKGPQPFVVNDIFMSYSTTSGFAYLDRRWLRAYWGLDDATQISVYLARGADASSFIQGLRGRLSPAYSLEILNNRELRDKILAIFDRSFAITYAIEVIAIFVSLIGVINTLLALVLEKKREISIIRYLGGNWRQIQGVLVLSAGISGTAGIGLGLLMGSLMSMIFIHVINKISFGWEVALRIPVGSLLLITAALFLTILAAGLLPARVARKIDPQRYISFE